LKVGFHPRPDKLNCIKSNIAIFLSTQYSQIANYISVFAFSNWTLSTKTVKYFQLGWKY